MVTKNAEGIIEIEEISFPKYKWHRRRNSPEGEFEVIEIEFEEAIILLKSLLPTAFSSFITPEGVTVPGIEYAVHCFNTGTPKPDSLPDMQQIIYAIRRVMRIDPDVPPTICFQLFDDFLKAYTQLIKAKKKYARLAKLCYAYPGLITLANFPQEPHIIQEILLGLALNVPTNHAEQDLRNAILLGAVLGGKEGQEYLESLIDLCDDKQDPDKIKEALYIAAKHKGIPFTKTTA